MFKNWGSQKKCFFLCVFFFKEKHKHRQCVCKNKMAPNKTTIIIKHKTSCILAVHQGCPIRQSDYTGSSFYFPFGIDMYLSKLVTGVSPCAFSAQRISFLFPSLLSESSCVCLQCCGPARSCSLQGFDQQGHQVFYFDRPLRMDACCLGCCLMEISAYTGQKQLIGTVCQR